MGFFEEVMEEKAAEAAAKAAAKAAAEAAEKATIQGRAEGRKEGRAEGRAEGIIEGQRSAYIKCARKMLRNQMADFEIIGDLTEMFDLAESKAEEILNIAKNPES